MDKEDTAMKKLLICVVALIVLWALPCSGFEDNYLISRDDALDARTYNRERGSIYSDYDHDGTPNIIDPWDNHQFRHPAFRDYDGDGTPNIIDPYYNRYNRRR